MRISLHIVVALLLIALIYREILKGIVYCLLYAEITGTAATVSGERWFDSSGLSWFLKKYIYLTLFTPVLFLISSPV